MAKEKAEKTNAMRILDRARVNYTLHDYTFLDSTVGTDIALALKRDPNTVFKTLVTVSGSKKNYVFIVPVCHELDLKKAARIVGEKKIDMLKSKELLPLTGYIHGGCSPIGMKKLFCTVMHETAKDLKTVCVSGGKIGYQVELAPSELSGIVPIIFADIVV